LLLFHLHCSMLVFSAPSFTCLYITAPFFAAQPLLLHDLLPHALRLHV
jgi:hypothetical protein